MNKSKYSVENVKRISGFTNTTIERAFNLSVASDREQGYLKYGDRQNNYWKEFVDLVVEDPKIIEWLATGIVKEFDKTVIKFPHEVAS
jgi:hypothetical protein